MIYQQRMQKVLDEAKNIPRNTRQKFVLSKLEGEYAIKAAKNGPYYCGDDNLYLGFLTFFVGLEFSRKKTAARFKKQELPEVIAKLNNLKGFKLVKIK